MKKYDVMHAEKYQSGGEEKTRWIRCGAVLSTRSGRFALKMDVMPVNGDGWFQLFEPNDDGEKRQSKPAPPAPVDDDPSDDLPF